MNLEPIHILPARDRLVIQVGIGEIHLTEEMGPEDIVLEVTAEKVMNIGTYLKGTLAANPSPLGTNWMVHRRVNYVHLSS